MISSQKQKSLEQSVKKSTLGSKVVKSSNGEGVAAASTRLAQLQDRSASRSLKTRNWSGSNSRMMWILYIVAFLVTLLAVGWLARRISQKNREGSFGGRGEQLSVEDALKEDSSLTIETGPGTKKVPRSKGLQSMSATTRPMPKMINNSQYEVEKTTWRDTLKEIERPLAYTMGALVLGGVAYAGLQMTGYWTHFTRTGGLSELVFGRGDDNRPSPGFLRQAAGGTVQAQRNAYQGPLGQSCGHLVMAPPDAMNDVTADMAAMMGDAAAASNSSEARELFGEWAALYAQGSMKAMHIQEGAAYELLPPGCHGVPVRD